MQKFDAGSLSVFKYSSNCVACYALNTDKNIRKALALVQVNIRILLSIRSLVSILLYCR